MTDAAPPRIALAPAALSALSDVPPAGHVDIGLVGDIYFRQDAVAGRGPPRPADLRNTIWEPLAGASLIVANLEAPITRRDTEFEQKPHVHKTSPATLDLFDRRFVLSLANNHIMDFGTTGLADTIDALDAAGIAHAGAGLDIDEAKAPCLINVYGVQVAVICAADPRFYPAGTARPGTCPAHVDLLVDGIRSVTGSAGLTVVSLHLGLEHVSIPSTAQLRLAEVCLAAGAHIVHFHHSHRLSGAATGGRGVVLFGTGNYVFTKTPKVRIPSSRCTAAWRVRLDTTTGQVVAVGATPAAIDATGLPQLLEGVEAARELARLQQCSEQMLGGIARHWARLRDLLSPGFLRANLHNYGFLLRHRGPQYVLTSLLAGLRAQFGRHAP